MPLLAELEEFVGDHRPHGTLTCDATEPAGTATCSQSPARAASPLSGGSRGWMPSWTCFTSRL